MAPRNEHILTAPAVVLGGSTLRHACAEGGGQATLACAASMAPALLAAALPLLAASCLGTAALACALACAVAVACCLGAASVAAGAAEGRRRASFVALLVIAAALVAELLVPAARSGFFAFVNGLVCAFDDAYGAYAPYVAGTATLASSPLFGALLGAFTGALAWLVTAAGASGLTLLVAVCASALSLRLGLGANLAGAGCLLGVGAWVARCRTPRLLELSRSVRVFGLNAAICACICIAAFGVCCALFSPMSAVDGLHAAAVSAYTQLRYGSDSLPEGDLSQAVSMNNEEGQGGLSLTYTGATATDLYLRGFVGARFSGGSWSALSHAAYEGSWHGMGTWLSQQGLASATQRSSYDDEAAAAGEANPVGKATLAVDASHANRRYVYAPYTLRSLSGAGLRQTLEGSLGTGLVPSGSYSEVIDVVDQADVLANTGWLATSASSYTEAERVYAAFVEENYLQVDEVETKALNELVFTDDAWGSGQASDYETISRVRAVLAALAGYTTSPDVPSGSSFIRWFVSEARMGNSADFATAAVLAFRSQGIPARYAEGYRASAEALARAASNNASLELTAADAHAWAEVYLDGIGWTPVEVTPGFYTQAIDAEQVITVDASLTAAGGDVAGEGLLDDEAGGHEHDDARAPRWTANPVLVVLVLLVAALAVLVGAAIVAVVQRAWRVSARERRISAADQQVCVPALYAYLAELMDERGIGFDEARPLDCLAAFEGAFAGIDTKEYRRVIELHQAFAFGGRELKPNELRTVTRFDGRLHEALPKPKNLLDGLRRRYVRAL